MAILKNGSSGSAVKTLQEQLNTCGWLLTVDGKFGTVLENAVKGYQSIMGLTVDGVAGDKTNNSLKAVTASLKSNVQSGSSGEGAKFIQACLNHVGAAYAGVGAKLTLDGKFGTKSVTALRIFQEAFGIKVDGIAHTSTKRKLITSLGSINARMCAWAEYCGKYIVSHGWHYEHGAFSTANSWYKACHTGKKIASCAAFVSWVSQLAGILALGKEISHTSGGQGSGAKAVKYGSNLAGGKFVYPNKLYSSAGSKRGDINWFDSNICIYAGNGKWWDAGGPFSANCDKSHGNKFTNIPSSPTYDKNMKVCAYYRLSN